MSDINDRLDRLNKREALQRRAHDNPVAMPADGLGEDFVEVLEAVGRVVRRHPGLSIMVAPADGRSSQAVIRISERDGSVQTAVIRPPGSTAPRPPVAQSVVPEPVVPEPGRDDLVPRQDSRHEDARVGADQRGPGQVRVGPNGTGSNGYRPGAGRPDPVAARADLGSAPGVFLPVPSVAADQGSPADGPALRPADGRHARPVDHLSRSDLNDQTSYLDPSGFADPLVVEPPGEDADLYRAESEPYAGEPEPYEDEPDPYAEAADPYAGEPADVESTSPRLAVPESTSRVVSRLAQLLREDPSLAASWARDPHPG